MLSCKLTLDLALLVNKYKGKLGKFIKILGSLYSVDLMGVLTKLENEHLIKIIPGSNFFENRYYVEFSILDLCKIALDIKTIETSFLDLHQYSFNRFNCDAELYKENVIVYYENINSKKEQEYFEMINAMINIYDVRKEKFSVLNSQIYFNKGRNVFSITKEMEYKLFNNEDEAFLGSNI